MDDVVRAEGKLPMKVGDIVRVERALLTSYGVKIKDAGWTRGKIVRFIETDTTIMVEVTKPGRMGTRTVNIDRVVRNRTQKEN